MIIVEGTALIPEAALAEAKTAMEAMILASRAEDGCIEYAYGFDLLEPNRLRIIERWKDLDTLKAHFAMPHMATFRAALAEIKPQDFDIRMYDAEPQPLPL